jgi:TPR repeat protein
VLRERLSPEELVLAVNPVAATPEMARWAAEIVGETQGDLARARKLFEHLVARPRANGGSTRTAPEVFAAWKDLGQFFQCQEYAKLFTALARSLDLPAFYVHVERDYCDRIVDHDCAVVFAEGKAWLVDPAYTWFGVPHLEFRVLDDVQAVAHHAFQPHDGKPEVALCRAGCKLDPEFTWGRWNLVMALIESDQAEEARKELDAARQNAPENWRGYQLEGLIAVKQVRNERAVEWLRKAAAANPDAGDTHLVLGLALFRTGQQAGAREALLAGLRRPHKPGNEEMATETLALIEEALGTSSNVPGTSKSALTAGMYLNLGGSFLYGPQPNYTEAAKWLRKAADMGDSQAQGMLGVLYWNGRGVPQDPVIAVGWLRKAADGGEAQAMRNLGKAYDQGLGIEKDQKEAMRWMRRAAETGDAQAQAILGKACYEGWITPKNLGEALAWLRLAEEGYATPSEGNFGETDRASALRKVRHLLKEVELFTSSEEKAEANAWVKRFKAKQAAAPGAQRTPTVPPADPAKDAATDHK